MILRVGDLAAAARPRSRARRRRVGATAIFASPSARSLSSNAISGSSGTSGYRSSTRRWPYSATGFSANTSGFTSPLRSSTSACPPAGACPTRIDRDVRIRRLHARRQLERARCDASMPSRSSTRRSGSLQHAAAGSASGALDSTMTRVYSCAGHRRADAIRAACAHAAGASALRGGQQHPLAEPPPLQTDTISAPRERAMRGDLGVASVTGAPSARRRDRVRRPSCAGVRKRRSTGPAGGNRPATRSGHSTRHALSLRKQSARPAVSHSLDLRTDKNQSDTSINSKMDNIQPGCTSGLFTGPSSPARATRRAPAWSCRCPGRRAARRPSRRISARASAAPTRSVAVRVGEGATCSAVTLELGYPR